MRWLSCLVILSVACIPRPGAAADADSILADIDACLRRNDFAAAESVTVAVERDAESRVPPDSLLLALAFERRAHILWATKDRLDLARDLARRSTDLRVRLLGRGDRETARALFTLGRVLAETGDFAAADSLIQEARSIRAALGDTRALPFADAELGTLAYKASRAREALAYLERAYDGMSGWLEESNPELCRVVYVTGLIHRELGEPREAIPWFERALAGYRAQYGARSDGVAHTETAIASCRFELQEYDLARASLHEALVILEEIHGSDSPLLSWPLEQLAEIDAELGNYARARESIERAVACQRGVANRIPLAEHLEFLARNSRQLGDPAGALVSLREALTIREEVLEPDNASIGSVREQIGRIEEMRGDWPAALREYETAERILAAAFGEADYRTGITRGERAVALTRVGRFEEARPLAQSATEVVRAFRGEQHLDTATAELGLARVLRASGDASGAAAELQRCLATRRALLGEDHPAVGDVFAELSEAFADQGDDRAAFENAIRAERIGRDHFRMLAETLSERSALQYGITRPSGLGRALALAARHPDLVRPAWDALIASRAVVLDEMAERLRASWVNEDPDVAELREEYVAASRRLAHLLVDVGGEAEPVPTFARVAAARDDRDRAEAALSRASVRARDRRERVTADLGRIESSLPDDASLVAYAEYDVGVRSYVAFVLPRAGGAPVAVDLGPAAPIDAAIEEWRREASGEAASRRDSAQALVACRDAGRVVRERIWDPVIDALVGARVFVVPDGALQLVNIAALPIGEDRYLIDEDRLLHVVSAERDLLRSRDSANEGLLAVGNATFDDAPATAPVLLAFRGATADCETFRHVRFSSLPRSGEEARRIAEQWRARGAGDVVVLEGIAASESEVKRRAPGHRVLHFATHGFFLSSDCAEAANGDTRGIGSLRPTGASTWRGARALRLAGIALAGANQRDPSMPEDGILTAEEVAALDLQGVEWVVLSACDTGLGDVASREGVFGLRRAFQVAGAHTVISSLWAVRDEDALRWMDALYEARLAEGLDTAAAVRQATRAELNRLRENGESTHPSGWAAFLAAGEWR
ncbi:MAG: CHAT domain-containing tetratricopeptide repeat protein [bacterium]